MHQRVCGRSIPGRTRWGEWRVDEREGGEGRLGHTAEGPERGKGPLTQEPESVAYLGVEMGALATGGAAGGGGAS